MASLPPQTPAPPVEWKFLTNHGLALIHIAGDSGIRLRDIADKVGITERSAHRIVSDLVESGYISRERTGRRNTYEVRTDLPVGLAMERDLQLGDLLGAVFTTRAQAKPQG